MKNNAVCLIGGTGRSGTTILSKIFSMHPETTNVPEWRFLVDPDGILDFYTTVDRWSPYHYDLQIKRLQKLLKRVSQKNPLGQFFAVLNKIKLLDKLPLNLRPQYADLQALDICPEFNQLCNKLINELISIRHRGYWVGMPPFHKSEMIYNYFPDKKDLADILSRFLRLVIQNVMLSQHANYYLEKNTWNILWFDRIIDLLPEAKLVHIYRDPRDVVASYTKQSWMPSSPEQSAVIYRDIINQWHKIKKKIPTNSYIEISLEELVSNKKQTIQKICDFWQLPWSNILLEIDLSRSNSGRWKKDFNDNEQMQVQEILKNVTADLGYY